MYKVFCQKFQISIRTLHDFSIVTISEFVLLANRCTNPNVDFLIVASKLLIPKLAYIALALHRIVVTLQISVNDICNVSPMPFKILYADDTCVLISGNHLNDLIDRQNKELISLNNRFKANKLSLNTKKKSFFMTFHRSSIKPNVIKKSCYK